MGQRLKDKVAIVTGSGQNIGRATALLMAQEGARVVTNNRAPGNPSGDAGSVADEIKQAGGTALPVFADVSTLDGARALVDATVDAFGTVDIMINNAAGSGGLALFEDVTEERWDTVLAHCLKSQFNCIHLTLPMMKERGEGRIINLSSRVGLAGFAGMAPYSAAKAGTLGLTWTLAEELGRTGITVNCIVPTANESADRGEAVHKFRSEVLGVPYAPPPVPEMKSPHCIAPLVVFLCSPEAADVTGQTFYATGGEVTLYSKPARSKSMYTKDRWSVDDLVEVFSTAFGQKHWTS